MAHYRVTFLEQMQLAHLRRSRPVDSWNGFVVCAVDMRPLKLNLNAFVPFLFLEEDPPPVEDVDGWREILTKLIAFSRERSSGSIVFVTNIVLPPKFLDDPDLERHSVAVIDSRIVKAFAEARDQEARYCILGSAMARTVGYAVLSPYSPGSPALANRFFGRDGPLNRVLTGKAIHNSTIVGNRRIGKTSLMHEVRERLKQVYVHNTSLHFAELYGSKCRSTWDAVYLIFQQIGVRVPNKLAKYGAIAPRYISRMPQLLHDFARTHQTQVVLFIDEYDELLARDALHDYEFTHLLRETAMAELGCYVIIAGFRYLMQMRTRQDSPLYNFTQEIQLTPLTKEESLKMITLPLARLGVDLSQTNIPGIIHRETRGQPELIQMYCQSVIQSCAMRRRPPSEAELLKIVNQNPEFNRTITHTFLSNANEFEQIICLELMKKAALSQHGVAQYEFRFNEIEQILAAYSYSLSNSELAILVNNLAVGSFIERVKGGGAPGLYQFATPQLVRFCERVGFDNLIAKAKSKLGDRPPSLEAIIREPTLDATTIGTVS